MKDFLKELWRIIKCIAAGFYFLAALALMAAAALGFAFGLGKLISLIFGFVATTTICLLIGGFLIFGICFCYSLGTDIVR